MMRLSVIVASITCSVCIPAATANGAQCSGSSNVFENALYASAECSVPKPQTQGTGSGTAPYYTAYKWEPHCESVVHDPATSGTACASAILSCAPTGIMMVHLGLHDGIWHQLGTECRPFPTQRSLTPDQVAAAFAEIPLPSFSVITQPGAETLVNFETLFRVRAVPFERTVTVLGIPVTLAIRPASFQWNFGDGTTTTTESPGAPYPARDVTHRYPRAATVHPQVTVTWSARWRTGTRPWGDVPGTVTTTGPTGSLRVLEAIGSLS